jgi:hypothetical protein
MEANPAMKLLDGIRPALAAISLIAGCGVASADPNAAIANAGTLTCVLSAASANGTSRSLSCTFVRATGPNAQFSGHVKSFGAVAPEGAKIVLVWSVLAPKADVDVGDLAGRYVGSVYQSPQSTADAKDQTRSKAGGLIGGSEQSIRLVPMSVGPNLGTNVAASILDLELTSMKA